MERIITTDRNPMVTRSPGTLREFLATYAAGLRRGEVSVPCGDCSACRSVLVPLTAEEAARLPHVQIEDMLALDKRPDGSCVFLDGGRCSIYDARPRACRRFDCRALVLLGEQRGGAMIEALAQWTEFETPTAQDVAVLAAVRCASAESEGALSEAEILQRAAGYLAAGER